MKNYLKLSPRGKLAQKLLLLLLAIVASSTLKAQEKEPYIPILTDSMSYWGGFVAEFELSFGEAGVTETEIYNDTTYYNFSDTPSHDWFIEDTTTRKIYETQKPFNENEKRLVYDFSLEEGDSIFLPNYVGFEYWFYVDSIVEIDIYNGQRKAWFLHTNPEVFPYDFYEYIWVEGIGSLAGFMNPNNEAGLYYWGQSLLTCFYQGDSLIYKHDLAYEYGCGFELFDTEPPVLDEAWFEPDTVSFNDTVYLYFKAHDNLSEITGAYIELKSPSNLPYPDGGIEHIAEDTFRVEINKLNTPKFWNEIGTWELLIIRLTDSEGNSEAYFPDGVTFYVESINNISNNFATNVRLFPNPASEKITIKLENPEESNHTLEIYNVLGEQVHSETTINNLLDISLKSYPKGVYVCKITINNQIIYTTKFIKQ